MCFARAFVTEENRYRRARPVGEGMVRPEIMKEVQMIEDSLKRRVSVGAKISQAKVVKEFTKQVRELVGGRVCGAVTFAFTALACHFTGIH